MALNCKKTRTSGKTCRFRGEKWGEANNSELCRRGGGQGKTGFPRNSKSAQEEKNKARLGRNLQFGGGGGGTVRNSLSLCKGRESKYGGGGAEGGYALTEKLKRPQRGLRISRKETRGRAGRRRKKKNQSRRGLAQI